MENLKESSEILDALSDGMADAVEKAGQFVVRVNSRRRRGASGVVFGENLVLMADHPLQREDGLSVETHDGRKLAARTRRLKNWERPYASDPRNAPLRRKLQWFYFFVICYGNMRCRSPNSCQR